MAKKFLVVFLTVYFFCSGASFAEDIQEKIQDEIIQKKVSATISKLKFPRDKKFVESELADFMPVCISLGFKPNKTKISNRLNDGPQEKYFNHLKDLYAIQLYFHFSNRDAKAVNEMLRKLSLHQKQKQLDAMSDLVKDLVGFWNRNIPIYFPKQNKLEVSRIDVSILRSIIGKKIISISNRLIYNLFILTCILIISSLLVSILLKGPESELPCIEKIKHNSKIQGIIRQEWMPVNNENILNKIYSISKKAKEILKVKLTSISLVTGILVFLSFITDTNIYIIIISLLLSFSTIYLLGKWIISEINKDNKKRQNEERKLVGKRIKIILSNSFTFSPFSLLDIGKVFITARKYKFDGVELTLTIFMLPLLFVIKWLSEIFTPVVSIHLPWYGEYIYNWFIEKGYTQDRIYRLILGIYEDYSGKIEKIGKLLGIEYLVMHAALLMEIKARNLEFPEYIRERVLIENDDQINPFYKNENPSIDQMVDTMNDFNLDRVIFDTTHSGHCQSKYGDFGPIGSINLISKRGKKTISLHLSDYRENKKRDHGDDHLPLDDGNINWREIIRLAIPQGLEYIVLEVRPGTPGKDICRSKKLIDEYLTELSI